EPDELETVERARLDLLTRVESDLGPLERLSAAMQGQDPRHGVSLRLLVERLIELEPHRVAVAEADAEGLPGYAEWRERQATVRELERTLRELAGTATLAAHPWRWLPRRTLLVERPVEVL